MTSDRDKLSTICFKIAGVCFVLLICVPVISLIVSPLVVVDWSKISVFSIWTGAGVVGGLGGGCIANILDI